MAPINPSNSGRVWIKYSDGQNEHEVLFRHGLLTDAGLMVNLFIEFTTLAESDFYVCTLVSARKAAPGSDISVPIALEGSYTWGETAMPLNRRPYEVSVEGRTPGGRFVSYSWYGVKLGVPDNFRYTLAQAPGLAAGLVELENAAAAGDLCAIDRTAPIFKQYFNANYNSYWEAEIRP